MYYIIENQIRVDGMVNNTVTTRQNINSAVSFYHERFSKMSMNTEFPAVALLLTDENLNKVEHAIVHTMYVAPVEQAETEAVTE